MAVYAGLWILAVSTGSLTNSTFLLTVIFAMLTVASVGHAIVSETRAVMRMRFPAILNLAAWFLWLLVTAFSPLWKELLAYLVAR